MYKRNADSKSDLVISYLTLRKVIGILGMSFPAILALGAWIIGGFGIQRSVIGILHLVFAMLLFLTLIYFSLCLFTKTKEGEKPAGKKLARNRVYRTCGYIMLACILLVPVYHLFFKPVLDGLNPVFWLETIALLTFGISWFTKGQAILRDPLSK